MENTNSTQLTIPLDPTSVSIIEQVIKDYFVANLVPAQFTTAQRDTLPALKGLIIYNTTTDKLNFYNGSAWAAITSA